MNIHSLKKPESLKPYTPDSEAPELRMIKAAGGAVRAGVAWAGPIGVAMSRASRTQGPSCEYQKPHLL